MCMCGLFGFFYSAPTTNLNSNTTQTTRQSLACWDPIQGACSVEDEHIQFKQQSPDAQMHNRLSNVTWLGSHRVASPQLLFEYWRWCGECSVTDTEASEEICYCRKTWLWPFPITKLLPPPPPPALLYILLRIVRPQRLEGKFIQLRSFCQSVQPFSQ